MFGRKKTTEAEPVEETTVEKDSSSTVTRGSYTPKKGAPTPKRKEREAANRNPLIVDDRKAAKQAHREAVAEERAKMRIAMETGDERHMPVRDKGPQKRYARDFVDSRTGIGEWLMLIVIVLLLISFVPIPEIQLFISAAMIAVMALVVFEGIWVGKRLKKDLTAQYGELEPGVRWYGAMRALQLRRMRLPKPMVKRGEKPVPR